MSFAQTNIGKLEKAYVKETGEVILHFQGLRINMSRQEWEWAVQEIGLSPGIRR